MSGNVGSALTPFGDLVSEVEDLIELRRVADKTQVEVAVALDLMQPSKRREIVAIYLSMHGSSVEAIGGRRHFAVRLPSCTLLKQRGQLRARTARA